MQGGPASFREVQGFRQWWLWVLLLVTTLGTIGLFGYGIFVQIIQGTPWGDKPMSDAALLATGIGTTILVVGLTALLLSARLVTEVRSDGLHVRFFPMKWKAIPYETIASYHTRTYRPVRDYGGWGIRWGRDGKAYIVVGNEGLQLLLGDGEKILIGSQRPQELEAALGAWKR
ncbi:MAG: DUF6141 family protein [Acidimicrobiia bacterium]|nr:DUF6141 family protein [Acidimicrobiia bacterium]MDH3396874.1 DUF6141 family protein [Acidimicrobiia bacterium]